MMAQGIAVAPSPAAQKEAVVNTANYDEARIQIRVPSGAPLTMTFAATDPISAVYAFCRQSGQPQTFKLLQTYPRKVVEDGGQTLKDLGLVPSGALVLQL